MTYSPNRLPTVFVGCPYRGRFNFRAFKEALGGVPFRFLYANEHIKTAQLLDVLRGHITRADFCLFDISTWNPNVALEIGLAAGLKAEYYIMLNTRLSADTPSDIRGLQHISYRSLSHFDEQGLFNSVVRYFADRYRPLRRLRSTFAPEAKSQMKNYLALRVLARLRDAGRLRPEALRELATGTRLRHEEVSDIKQNLYDLRLVSHINRKDGMRVSKRLFAEKGSR